MDKRNYTLKENEIQDIKEKIREIKRKLIKRISKSKILKRKRKIKKYSILVEAGILYIVENLSFQRLADIMAIKHKIVMSDTAWKKQISKLAPVFYSVMMEYMKNFKSQIKANKILGHSNVYALDATDITTEGKKGTLLRAHVSYGITNKIYMNALIASVKIGESAKLHTIDPNGLYFADRAYGKTPQIEYICEHGANFIFRFSPSQVKFFVDAKCKKKIDFLSLIKERNEKFSFLCFFKHNKMIRTIRVIASPLPKEKADIAVQKVKRTSVKKQRSLQASTAEFAKWLFLSSSLSPDDFSDEDIISAYRNRWQIELHFKRSKSLLNFHRLRTSSVDYAFNIVSMWLAVTAFVYSLFPVLLDRISFDISTFNVFSIFTFLIS